MTETEYKKQSERLEKYKKAENRMSNISEMKSAISKGIISINCAYDREIHVAGFGQEFEERLAKVIMEILDLEIEDTAKYTKNI